MARGRGGDATGATRAARLVPRRRDSFPLLVLEALKEVSTRRTADRAAVAARSHQERFTFGNTRKQVRGERHNGAHGQQFRYIDQGLEEHVTTLKSQEVTCSPGWCMRQLWQPPIGGEPHYISEPRPP